MRLLCLLLLIVCTFQASAKDERQGLQGLLDALEEKRVVAGIPGVGLVLVTETGPLSITGFGVADKSSGREFDPQTGVRLGSITKAFTALALLKLQEQGRVSLDADIRQYVAKPPYQNAWEDDRPMRLSYLLEQTSGLGGLSEAEFEHNESDPVSLEEAFNVNPESRKVQWRPGVYHSYSNSNAAIAAYVLEQVTDERFEEYVAREIFAPLNMRRSSFFLSDELRPDMASGYAKDGETIPYWHLIFRPFGAINSTLPEMSNFLQMLINKGRFKNQQLFSAASIERMETVKTTLAAKSGLQYGYGLGNEQWYRDGHLFRGHAGEAHGHLAQLAYSRENNRGYFLAVNGANSEAMAAMQAMIEEWLVRDAAPVSTKPSAELSDKVVASLLGEYEQATQRFASAEAAKLLLLTDGEALYSRVGSGGPLRKLIPVTPSLFRRAGEPDSSVAIIQQPDGTVYYQSDEGNFNKRR